MTDRDPAVFTVGRIHAMEMVARISKCLDHKDDYDTEVLARTTCLTCKKTFASRAKLFRHLRREQHGAYRHCSPLIRELVSGNFAAAARRLALRPIRPADAYATVPADTGESPLLVATARCCAMDPASGERPRAHAVIAVLAGLNEPFRRPVQLSHQHPRPGAAVQSKRRGTKRVGEHLALWRAHTSFRGSAAELAAWCGDDEVLVAMGTNITAASIALPEVLPGPVTEAQLCKRCNDGYVYDPSPRNDTTLAQCDDCGAAACTLCGELGQFHMADLRWVGCAEAKRNRASSLFSAMNLVSHLPPGTLPTSLRKGGSGGFKRQALAITHLKRSYFIHSAKPFLGTNN